MSLPVWSHISSGEGVCSQGSGSVPGGSMALSSSGKYITFPQLRLRAVIKVDSHHAKDKVKQTCLFRTIN